MLAFTSTGCRRAGYTGRHINGWLRANCSTESGKSFVLPNSLPGWLVILLGHWRERKELKSYGEKKEMGELSLNTKLLANWLRHTGRQKQVEAGMNKLMLDWMTSLNVRNLSFLKSLISSFIVSENFGLKFTAFIKLGVWKQPHGSRVCCLPFASRVVMTDLELGCDVEQLK